MASSIKGIAGHLVRFELWPVAFFVAASMVWPPLLPAAIVVALFFWPVRLLADGRLSLSTPGDWPTVLLILTIPVTLYITALPEISMLQGLRLLSGVLLFYAIVNWTRTRENLRLLLTGITLTGLLLALVAPLSVEWTFGKLPFIPPAIYERFVILISDTVHPNVLAGILILILPVPLGVLLFAWRDMRWLERIIYILSSLSIFIVLVLTQSRGSWIALSVVLLSLLFLRWRWGWIGFLLAVLASVVAVYILGLNTITQALASNPTIGDLNGRFDIWSRAIYMLGDFPFTGIGMGSFEEVANILYPFSLRSPAGIPHAHNLFLQIGVDLGVPGLIAWLSILMVMVSVSWSVYSLGRGRKSGWFTGLGAGLLLSQLALITHGMTDAVTWGMVRSAPIVWSIWGIIVAARFIGDPYQSPVLGEQASGALNEGK